MISALVLTLNEERNIDACLDSLSWSNDVVVLDSGSTDRTVERCKARGARVVTRAFDNWAGHQNWALENIEFRHPWVYYSDADEVVTPSLAREMSFAVAGPTNCVAFRVRYKNYFMGRWIRHSSLYPTWVLRLFRPAKVHWERVVNPVAIVDGPVGRLQSHFEHFSFNKGLEAWIDKHNRYSTGEAHETVEALRRRCVSFAALLSTDASVRRKALKELSARIPCRPAARFLYMYLLRAGCLDGYPGLVYCSLLAAYEGMIALKVEELNSRRSLSWKRLR